LRTRLDCERLVVTLGPEGAALVERDGGYLQVPAAARRQVFDVTGAGDTVIAVMTAALAAGATSPAALRLSQVAAGLVISLWGNAQVSAEEIAAALDEGDPPSAEEPSSPRPFSQSWEKGSHDRSPSPRIGRGS
ncbi:MAG TPA: PfkB family carbohydrate kinase, partial [Nitrolancea sp.]|nr:PfkB family carbohydrate kinase [Nitrolancea sp.]